MNRILLLICLVACINAYAQDVGFHAGATLATMQDGNEVRNDDENYESVPGVDIGLDLKFGLTDNLSVMTGLSFYQNGFHEDARRNGYSGIIEKNVRLNYVKLPVSFMLQTNEMGNARFGIRGGAYFARLLGGEFEAIDWYEEVQLSDAYIDSDWGLTVGASLSIQNFTIDVGYDLGIKNIDADGTVLTSDTVRNRSWNLKLSYFLKQNNSAGKEHPDPEVAEERK